ncbi:GMC oxidoreductase [Modestobacter marinus]|uniref:Choline dehydrogenase-like flavoprotein n=1 Tax=Modestobacter marinus TaxID=477641 RepID=A0A846LIE8_9ACTN|nr:GMC family oxidoreductase [Modestobacter marinus]NIH66344.1 choline dehydrogenase-like flavoprotein [Modestobacter marinus]
MLLNSPPAPEAVFDLCVVGAGPAGLSLALEAARGGLRVLIIEAGLARKAVPPATRFAATTMRVLDHRRHAPLSETTRTGIGGTSWLWGGRCVPFESIDYELRAHVTFSGWPICPSDLAPWQNRAAEYLDCGSADFQTEPMSGWQSQAVSTSQQERWSRRPQLAPHLGAQVIAHPTVSVLTGAVATDVRFNPAGTAVTQLRVRWAGTEVPLTARDYVLACGGLATTRLLLHVQRREPAFFGGSDGPLGRYYMGHLTGSIASISITPPELFTELDFRQEEDGTYVRRRFTLMREAQIRGHLLHTSFYLGNLPFRDARHGSPTLSAFFLALTSPLIGRCLAGAETRRRNAGRPVGGWGAHLQNIARRPRRLPAEVAAIVRLRYLSSPRRSVFVIHNDRGTYALRYHAEQVPNPHSRVRCNGRTGADGLPGVDIDLRYSDQDVESVLRAHQLLDAELASTGVGHLIYDHPEERRSEAIRQQAMDGYHQIGTTRMSADPSAGVVDPDCRVHGFSNLFVASSSVFPTAGEANPTFMTVALAVRLAHHLTDPARRRSQRSERPGSGWGSPAAWPAQ